MQIITRSESNRLRIQNSFNRIINNCSVELKSTIEKMPLMISDEISAVEIYNDEYGLFRNAHSEGFGSVKGNVIYQENRVHLLVLNITQIDTYTLTESEFDGVFSHELGHLFNENPTRERPSVLKGNSLIEIENAKQIELKEIELYADYFSKMTGTSNGLLGSMQKYIASENCINRELFIERIRVLNTNTIFLGKIKEVK